MSLCGLTFELTGPEQRDGICASVFAGTNAGTLCRVRLSDLLGVAAEFSQQDLLDQIGFSTVVGFSVMIGAERGNI